MGESGEEVFRALSDALERQGARLPLVEREGALVMEAEVEVDVASTDALPLPAAV